YGGGESSPMRIEVGTDDDFAVRAAQQVSRRGQGSAVPGSRGLHAGHQVFGQRSGLQVQGHVIQAEPDDVAAAGPLAAGQRREDAVTQRVTARSVARGETDL